MPRFSALILNKLSKLLESDERDAVLGDFAELNIIPVRSVYELCGLILRRQILLWKNWQPWFALLFVVGLVGIRLVVLASSLAIAPLNYFLAYLRYGVRYESGLSLLEEITVWFLVAFAVVLWSWTAGFLFTLLSRRTALFTNLIFCAAWFCGNAVVLGFFQSDWRWVLFIAFSSAFAFLPFIWGARSGFRPLALSMRQVILVASFSLGVAVLVTWVSGWPQAALERWSEGALPGEVSWQQRLMFHLELS